MLLIQLLTIFIALLFGGASASKKDRIKLKDVTTLTLYHGQWTTGRRTRPVPQLQCIGGTAMCKFLPKTVQCYNRGSDGVDVQWECKADIPSNMRFNKIEVTCEGYDYPEDDYVLTGSCGLEYSIDTTDGSRPFPEPHFDRPDPRNIPKSHVNHKKRDGPSFLTTFVLGCLSFCMWIIYKCCINPFVGSESRQGYRSSPPPSATVPPPPGFKTEYARSAPPHDSPVGVTEGGNGFLSAFGIGAILGYLFANRGQQEVTIPQDPPAYTRTRRREYVRDEQPHSGWFDWFRTNNARKRTKSHEQSSAQPSSSDTSDVSRNASAFGGTKRR